MASDLRIASPEAQFRTQFIKVGIGGCDIGISYTLPHAVGSSRAFDLIMTARRVGANGIPLGWVTAGANRNDSIPLEPTLEAVRVNGYLAEIETLYLDRGYDSEITRVRTAAVGLDDVAIQPKRPRGFSDAKQPMRLGLRWVVEATHSWWSNYGQLRRNTDRKAIHRHTALSLATIILITARLLQLPHPMVTNPLAS